MDRLSNVGLLRSIAYLVERPCSRTFSSIFRCLPFFAGCGVGPDTLWEVSRLDGARPNSCYANGKPPTTTTTQTGVQTNVGPWELYEGPESKMYLVLADKKTVIEGTKGDSYSFQWSVTEVDTAPPQGMGTLTDAIATTWFQAKRRYADRHDGSKETHSCSGTLCGG